jgi:hypothetical protein
MSGLEGMALSFCGTKNIILLGLNCILLKENSLKMSEFLKNKYFSKEKFSSYN